MEKLRKAIAQLGARGYVKGSSVTAGYVYNPIPFPGCENIPCHRPNSGERWKIISKHTEFKGKTVLDYGCATGYFSFMAARAGASVIGVDHDSAAINVCKEVARCFKVKDVAFWEISELSWAHNYDVAFVLAVLNWLGEERGGALCQKLSEKVSEVWVEIPLRGDGRGGASWLTSNGAIAGWLLHHFTNVIAYGSTQGPHRGQMRTLFRCT